MNPKDKSKTLTLPLNRFLSQTSIFKEEGILTRILGEPYDSEWPCIESWRLLLLKNLWETKKYGTLLVILENPMIKDPCSHLYREQKDKKTYIYPWRPNAKEILHVPRENQMIFELRTTEKRTLKKYRRIKSYPWITKEKRTLHLFRENQMIFKPNIYPSRRRKSYICSRWTKEIGTLHVSCIKDYADRMGISYSSIYMDKSVCRHSSIGNIG